jgi:hypothetical protein
MPVLGVAGTPNVSTEQKRRTSMVISRPSTDAATTSSTGQSRLETLANVWEQPVETVRIQLPSEVKIPLPLKRVPGALG